MLSGRVPVMSYSPNSHFSVPCFFKNDHKFSTLINQRFLIPEERKIEDTEHEDRTIKYTRTYTEERQNVE